MVPPDQVRMLNIVVSCTYRKRRVGEAGKLPSSGQIRLQDCVGTLEERAESWWKRLDREDSPTLPAERLYAGEHWSTALELVSLARNGGRKANLWVCSAGYGLVPVDAPLKPYSATFSPGSDSVHRPDSDECSPSEANDLWWGLLSKRDFSGRPRTISDLYGATRNSRLIVVASERYLSALRGDLLSGELSDPDRALLVSAGYPNKDGLSDYLLPADARLQPRVGGVRQALNARLAQLVLSEQKPGEGFEQVRKRFKRRLSRAPALKQYDRAPLSDDCVRKFLEKEIRASAQRGERPSHSPLLRVLRDGGHACEQKRFRRLFFEVKELLNA
jgi:hypothetical protein